MDTAVVVWVLWPCRVDQYVISFCISIGWFAGGTAVQFFSTVASQQEGCGFDSGLGLPVWSLPRLGPEIAGKASSTHATLSAG